MIPKILPPSPLEMPKPEENPEIIPIIHPEEPIIPKEDPAIIPDENPIKNPPHEIPPPAEAH